MEHFLLLNLPEDLVYNVLEFIDHPSRIAPFLCTTLSLLCVDANHYVQTNQHIWEKIMYGYGVQKNPNDKSLLSHQQKKRRTSKRLSKNFKDQVLAIHRNIRNQTEFALQALSEMIMSKRDSLTLSKLRSILSYYGPNININQRSAIGATFLVDCCRARYVEERVILSCVKELIRKHHAQPNVPAVEGNGIFGYALPPLVVASARAMPNVVRFLLNSGASKEKEGTSRFRLFSNPSKSVSGTYTPLDFANAMKSAEIENNIQPENLASLQKCIRILEKFSSN